MTTKGAVGSIAPVSASIARHTITISFTDFTARPEAGPDHFPHAVHVMIGTAPLICERPRILGLFVGRRMDDPILTLTRVRFPLARGEARRVFVSEEPRALAWGFLLARSAKSEPLDR
jgi:hypothetical protein